MCCLLELLGHLEAAQAGAEHDRADQGGHAAGEVDDAAAGLSASGRLPGRFDGCPKASMLPQHHLCLTDGNYALRIYKKKWTSPERTKLPAKSMKPTPPASASQP